MVVVATHSGSFHADDVLAFALIQVFVDRDAELVRTRDLAVIGRADIAVDVGGEFDPARRRFDHHQAAYDGPLSSAGMVLDWLEDASNVTPEVAAALRHDLVDHVDAVDNGRLTPTAGVPCFSTLVAMHNHTAKTPEDSLARFHDAAAMAAQIVRGVAAGVEQIATARAAVLAAMDAAVAAGRAVLFLDADYVWKPAYFQNGGAQHPTDFVLHPADDSWRIVAIPPRPGSFDQKRPLPAAWAGLTDAALAEVIGVEGARFCHKNRFIAVFATREGAVAALETAGLMHRPGTMHTR